MTQSFAVADMTVHRIVELSAPFLNAYEMLPALDSDTLNANKHWLSGSIDSNEVFHLLYQSYVVKTPHHTILVDSCLGNHKVRPRPEWHMKSDETFMKALACVGLTVHDIDYVMCTHLHGDHVGWNTKLENGVWVPTFPNAKYVFGKRELDSTIAAHATKPNVAYQDSVLPILAVGRGLTVEDDFCLGDHVRLLPTPGHTDGHVAICFGRENDDLVMAGDLIHVPLQMKFPELSFSRDKDAALAAVTRRSFLERYCDSKTLCCTAHFPSPSTGYIKRWGDGYRMDESSA